MTTRGAWWRTTGAVLAVVALGGCGADDGAEADAGAADADAGVSWTADAQSKVLNLYVTRQEYIELYYGSGGQLSGGEALGRAVDRSEVRFHELMELLGEGAAPTEGEVTEAVDALRAAHDQVLEEAREADVPLTLPESMEPLQGTPAGGIEDWVADIRQGLAAVTDDAGASTGSDAS